MTPTKRILLVEDEPGLVMTLEDRLKAEGYRVDSEGDGDRALEKALSEPFDLIILDVMLPGRDGFDICRELRKDGVEIPILFLTARGDVTDRVVGLKLGGDDYLPKPFDMSELTTRVEVLLRRSPSTSVQGPETYQFGDIHVDFRKAEVVKKRGRCRPFGTRVQASPLLHRAP